MPDTVSSNPLEWFFLWPCIVSSHECADQYSAEYSRGLSGVFLCSFLIFCTLSHKLYLCWFSQTLSSISLVQEIFLAPQPWSAVSFKLVSQGNCRTSFVCLQSLWDYFSSLPHVQHLEDLCFIYLFSAIFGDYEEK